MGSRGVLISGCWNRGVQLYTEGLTGVLISRTLYYKEMPPLKGLRSLLDGKGLSSLFKVLV